MESLGTVFAAHGEVKLRDRDRGWMGYEQSADVMVGTLAAGLYAFGGDQQRGWSYVGITGSGCQFVDSWEVAQEQTRDLPGHQLKRLDIAVDRFDAPHGYAQALEAYRAGEFSGSGGRPPSCERIEGEAPWQGRTLRVGRRDSDKHFRGYEKGKQLLGPAVGRAIAKGNGEGWETVVDQHRELVRGANVRVWDWMRYELELKPKTCPLPEDLIDKRDEYFAGAYPFTSKLLAGVQPEPLQLRRQRGPQTELAIALQWVRHSAGSTIRTALAAYEGDMTAVWDKIIGDKHNQALVDAGVLMVQHE